ncbi:uncharacterized protein LOC123979066 [Micropterus dolomieu]|uniref:uncharacterized protein LOC123979066 n=1 Tax=Micropterus dolomieu TaxID=147949 RepID=UPI001E8D07CF|nr:uncharacterized protein LOC123979066 [Micropterus dolomieu]
MAEVRHRLGRGTYIFAHKLCKRYLLQSLNKQGTSATRASSLSAGFLLGDIQNGELFGAVGVSQDGFTRVTPLHGIGNVWGDGNVSEYYYLGLNKEYSLPNKTQTQNIERNISVYRKNAKFRRTGCTIRSACPLQSLCSQFVSTRAYSGNGTRSEPLYKTKTGYYDILEVTPIATQAQIKTAYYKQSFVYHPDRNAGSEDATVRFSEISEAYTVLGNKALRKKYDRGLLSQSDLLATAKPSSHVTTGSSKQTESRRSVVGGDSRGGVFDFEKFFKNYYSEQLQRQRDIRVRKEEMLKKKQETIEEKELGRMMEMGVGLLLAMAVAILISLKRG